MEPTQLEKLQRYFPLRIIFVIIASRFLSSHGHAIDN